MPPGRDTLARDAGALLFDLAAASSALLLFAPLGAVFVHGAREGVRRPTSRASHDPDTLAAIRLTLLTAAIVVPVNTVFGICAAWAIAQVRVPRQELPDHADRPAARGVAGDLGPRATCCCSACTAGSAPGCRTTTSAIIFALPGIVLATMFVTFPYVARELIPLMQQLGNDEEEAAHHARRRRLDHVLPRHAAEDPLGPGVRRDPLQCARDGRVRRRVGGLRPHPRPDHHDAAAHRDPLQRIQLRRRVRRGVAAGAACGRHADHQDAGGMAVRAPEVTELEPAAAEVESRCAAARQACKAGLSASSLGRARSIGCCCSRSRASSSSRSSRSARLARPAARPGPGAGARACSSPAPARYEIARVGEDTLTAARLLADRPTLRAPASQELERAAAAARPAPFLRDRGTRRLRGVRRRRAGRRGRRRLPWSRLFDGGRRTGRGLHDREPASARPCSARSSRFPALPGVPRHDDPPARRPPREGALAAGRRRRSSSSSYAPALEAGRTSLHATCIPRRSPTGDIAVAAHRRARPVRRELAGLRLDRRSHRAHRGAAPRRAGRRARSRSFVRRLAFVTRPARRSSRCSCRSCSARRIGAPLQALTDVRGAARPGRLLRRPSRPRARRRSGARAHDGRHAAQPRGPHGELRQREAEAQAVLRAWSRASTPSTRTARIRYLNPQAARMLGVEPRRAIGKFCGDVLKPRDVNGRRPCDTRLPDPDGARRRQGAGDRIPRSAGGDAAHRRHHERRAVDGLQVQVMRDETELEAVRRARDTVLANISHEFRTPLAAQLASIELLRDGLETDAARAARRSWSLSLRARHAAAHAAHRQPARERAHRVRPARHPPPERRARRRCRGCARMLVGGAAHAAPPGAATSTLPEDLPLDQGDAPRLTQVFVNLLANASKFAPEGSAIRVGAAASRRRRRSTPGSRTQGPALPEGSTAARSSSASTARRTRSRTRAASASACGS